MELDKDETLVKNFMFEKFIPALHKLLREASPGKYAMWNGNTCRQSAVFGTKFLETFLPNYKWTAWDGNFSDMKHGQQVKYNHAWINGINKEERKGLLVDLSRIDRERLFIPVLENKYPKDHPEYKDMRIINKERMDLEQCMSETEYYTNLPGNALLSLLNLSLIEDMMNLREKLNDEPLK